MALTPGFSFVRLGDMELTLLRGRTKFRATWNRRRSGCGRSRLWQPRPGPATGRKAATTLERASYVDFHTALWPISELLPRLRLQRPAKLHQNPDAETHPISCSPGWKRIPEPIAVAGGSAWRGPRRPAAGIPAGTGVPAASEAFGPRPRKSISIGPAKGRNLDKNLDLIRDDLRGGGSARTGVDTVFLSLGGAAKISAWSWPRNLACGCSTRVHAPGLTYSGSDGNPVPGDPLSLPLPGAIRGVDRSPGKGLPRTWRMRNCWPRSMPN